jgi:DNA repair protein RecO (recombination protein O)
MLHTTRGIVLHQTRYSESSLILRIYTESLGLQSFIVKGVHSKRSKAKAAFFQPLTILNLVIDRKEGKSLHYIREISIEYPYRSLHTDMNRRSVLLFLADLLHRSIREENPDLEMFNWLYHALTWYDLSDGEQINFHLLFMMQLSRFLGFYPRLQPGIVAEYFDLREGIFTQLRPEHADYLRGEMSTVLARLQQTTFDGAGELQVSNKLRRMALDALLIYYRLHLPGFGELKSVAILKTVLE